MEMKKYEFVEGPTSDVEFNAYGKTLEELVENAALALSEIMCDLKNVKSEKMIIIETEGKDEEELMYNWLSEALTQHEIESMFFSNFKVQKLEKDEGEYRLRVEATGESIRTELILTVVKAVTFHKFSVKKNDYWTATVVVDV